MFKENGQVMLSATDVVNHLACEHLTTLNLQAIDNRGMVPAEDPQLALLQRKGDAWERRYLQQLRDAQRTIVEIPRELSRADAIAATHRALRSGADIIYQAALTADGFFGYADFLRRLPVPSALGDFSYEVLDTKLARDAKVGHVLQLCFYTWLVGEAQGSPAPMMHVVLGDGAEQSFRYADSARYFHRLRRRLGGSVATGPADTYPDPCEKCAQCRWNTHCEQQRLRDDHPWQVAGISRLQIRRLADAGIVTLQAIATSPPTLAVPPMSAATLERVRTQAAMQYRARCEGRHSIELRATEPGRGFLRLPPPSDGDLYFDMEGDPLHEDGLEYLFGVSFREAGELQFRAFWAHTREEEKVAFEQFMDFVAQRRARWPELHIYHYAAYENTALKRLMSLHGTREAEVDDLLRQGRLVDLYRVVAEAVVPSTPGYSLKDIEVFYRGRREGAVQNAGASIVAYETWLESRDAQLLESIERYNQDDCDSTAELHEWLRGIRPADLPWRGTAADAGADGDARKRGEDDDSPRSEEARRRQAEREAIKAELMPKPGRDADATPEERVRELVAFLVDFHQRCDKPAWWKIFSCADMTTEELIDDMECIGGMQRIAVRPPQGRGRLPTWVYRYPEQEFKTREGFATRADTAATVTVLQIDEDTQRIVIKPSAKALPDPAELSLGPRGPVNTNVLRNAVLQFATALAKGEDQHRALRALLRKELPRVTGRAPGTPIVEGPSPTLPAIIEAVAGLEDSYLFIQGPPGSGKTYTGSHVIVELLRRGKRVGVSSNSHKAINHLLGAVEEVARERGVRFHGEKKSSAQDPDSAFNGNFIESRAKIDDMNLSGSALLAGTAWLFADPSLTAPLDYLFVDEAGQVSLGNLIAMGLNASNIVLLGDQMQLAQPIQGVHPGRSGDSVLDYLLDGVATIPPERGIFLAETWRMHPDVCRFISDAVYDSRLKSAPGRDVQRLLLGDGAHPALRPTGIRFWPVEHDECSQRSEEEAREVADLYQSLLGQRWRDHEGHEAAIEAKHILVVAPYNLQVNLLRRTLPDGARVGTVDKFQGQEAAVVIVSLATSSGDDLPRNIEFLYSRNRLNVALSRAKCLSVLVASPRLMDVRCSTVEQIELVNTLCWVEEYAAAGS